MGQGLLHGDDIVDIAVVVVVDDGQGGFTFMISSTSALSMAISS